MKHKQINLILLLMAVSFTSIATEQTLTLSSEHLTNLGITLGTLDSISHLPLLNAPATITIPASKEYVVSSSQSGLINHMSAGVGDNIKQGAVLAEINSPSLLALQSQYLKAGSVLKLAKATYNRDQKLLKDGVIASRREQETQSQYDAALLEMNEARQLLEIAGMSAAEIEQLHTSHRLSSRLKIRTPVSGTVLEKMAVTGSHIDSMAPIYRLANLDEFWLEIAVPQERVRDIHLGDQVLIENSQHRAVITLLGKSVNPVTQTVMARAAIKAQPADVRVGQKVTIQIIQPSSKAIYKVPNTAIAQHEGKSYLFVHTPTGFDVAQIDVVGKQGDQSMISGNFNGTEKIAVKGAVALKANWLGLGSEE